MPDTNNIIVGAAEVQVAGADIGYTDGGVTVRYEREDVEVMADQALGVVRVARTMERMFIATTMLEVTLENLRKGFMLPAVSLSGSTLTLGYGNACWVDEQTITIIGEGPSCGTRTWSFSRCVIKGNREYPMLRSTPSIFAVEWEALKDTSGNFGTVIDS